jgi:hypothetical protein
MKKKKKIISKQLRKKIRKLFNILNKHILNYKLEIALSSLAMLIIFLIFFLFPNFYNLDNYNISSFENNNTSNTNENDIDKFIANIDDLNDENDINNNDNSNNLNSDDNRKDLSNEDILNNDEKDNASDYSDDSKELSSTSFINSFGDSFSSSAFLNREATNMHLDDISTALTFEPLYDFSKLGTCSGSECEFNKKVKVFDYGMEACLSGSRENCLKLVNNDLYFNGKALSLPEDIKRGKIISLSVGALDSKFLLGAVLAESADEYGLVYSFDGKDFESIISKNSSNNISSKYHRQGGKIGFGGNDDNFLILYAGYRGQAFQVYNNEIIDISHMFGLRVVNKGFMPLILKSGKAEDSTWYVCSLDKDNPKFIKLWQNNTNYIQGSLDLSSDIYTSSNLYDNFDYCYLSNNEDKKVYLSFRSNNANSNLKSLNIWQFKDNGFDNSYDYKVVSADILGKDNYVASNAVIKEIGLSANEKRYSNNINDFGSLYLSTDNNDWQRVDVGQRVFFDENTKNLYWRLDLSSADNYFSPWLDHVNRLDYLLTKIK